MEEAGLQAQLTLGPPRPLGPEGGHTVDGGAVRSGVPDDPLVDAAPTTGVTRVTTVRVTNVSEAGGVGRGTAVTTWGLPVG